MDWFKNKMYQGYLGVATKLKHVDPEADSTFYKDGKLTPNEFVMGGDQLVLRCPTWAWSTGKIRNKNLPDDKQFLITRNVPCNKRIKDILVDKALKEKENEDGWVETENTSKPSDVVDVSKEAEQEEKKIGIQIKEDYMDEPADFESMKEEIKVVKEDYKVVVDSETVSCRSYDISITYDLYFQTPRMWLFGYNEKNAILTEKELFEDIMQDYANKTVTMESHPHLGTKWISIHPCRHAAVMKKMIDTVESSKGHIEIYNALFVFLKFINSVVPTIEYDFTVDFVME